MHSHSVVKFRIECTVDSRYYNTKSVSQPIEIYTGYIDTFSLSHQYCNKDSLLYIFLVQYKSSIERQKDLTTRHLLMQLDLSAS